MGKPEKANTGEKAAKKPFDKKKWRENKYSNKAKSEFERVNYLLFTCH